MQAQVEQATAQVSRAGAQLETANTDFARNNKLYNSDQRAIARARSIPTKGGFDAAQAAFDAAKANLSGAKSNVAAAQAQVESAEASLAAAQATVGANEAAVRTPNANWATRRSPPPWTARVGNKNVELGNRVQVGQALYALVQPDLWVVANFKETQLTRMKAGQPVDVTIDAVGGKTFTGRVDSISPATGAQFALLPPDNATGNFTKVVQRVPVKIVFDAGERARVRGAAAAGVVGGGQRAGAMMKTRYLPGALDGGPEFNAKARRREDPRRWQGGRQGRAGRAGNARMPAAACLAATAFAQPPVEAPRTSRTRPTRDREGPWICRCRSVRPPGRGGTFSMTRRSTTWNARQRREPRFAAGRRADRRGAPADPQRRRRATCRPWKPTSARNGCGPRTPIPSAARRLVGNAGAFGALLGRAAHGNGQIPAFAEPGVVRHVQRFQGSADGFLRTGHFRAHPAFGRQRAGGRAGSGSRTARGGTRPERRGGHGLLHPARAGFADRRATGADWACGRTRCA